METTPPRLYRTLDGAMLGGVCAGIAQRFGYDVTLIRLIAALLAMAGGFGVVAYALLWIVLPVQGVGPVAPPRAGTTDLNDVVLAARRAADAARLAADAAIIAAEEAARAAHRTLLRRDSTSTTDAASTPADNPADAAGASDATTGTGSPS